MNEQVKKQNKPWLVLVFLCVAILILAMDDGVLNLALPAISNRFDASIGELQWMINAYFLGFATLLLTMGSLGDRFGRRRMFRVGLLLFGLGSLGAILSTSMVMLIACRGIMGLAGAMTLPQTLSIIKVTFPDPKRRVQAFGVWAGVFGLGYGIGPVVGGVLLDYFSWYSVFLLNVPIVVIALLGAYFFLQESKDERAPRLDIIGAAMSVAGLFLLVYGIIKAGERGWSDGLVIILLVIGAIVMAVFLWWEKSCDHPMLPLKFFKNMSFTGATVPMTLSTFITSALLFFLSQYFQSVQGYSPLQAALRILPLALIVMVVALAGAHISHAIGVKLPVSLGILIAGAGIFVLSLADVHSSYAVIFIGIVILAVGCGLRLSPATDSVMGSLPENQAGVGSAMDQTLQNLGSILGIAVLGAILNNIYKSKIEDLNVFASLAQGDQEAVRNSIQSAHIAAAQLPGGVSQQIIDGSNQAFTSGMSEAMIIGSIVMVAGSLFSLFFLPSRIRPSQQ